MEHPSLIRNGNISVANIEKENSVSNFVAKPIRRYFSIGLETKMPFLFCKFRNGNRVSFPLLF